MSYKNNDSPIKEWVGHGDEVPAGYPLLQIRLPRWCADRMDNGAVPLEGLPALDSGKEDSAAMPMAKTRQSGSVFMMVIFLVAILSTIVMAILENNTEEIQLMQNHVYRAEAVSLADAGLNDAIAQLRLDSSWTDGFTDKSFNGGTYSVVVSGSTLTATSVTAQGYTSRIEADVTMGSGPPHTIRVDALRINQ